MKQALTGAALLAAIAVGGVAVLSDSKVDTAAKDVMALASARDAGEALDYAVYKAERSDGGSVYYGLSTEFVDAGRGQALQRREKVTFLSGSPCRRRPAKSAVGTCNLRLSDGGERDFGADNVMQDGQWVDRGGCEEAPCAVFFGVTP
jgi:hypothetical protein